MLWDIRNMTKMAQKSYVMSLMSRPRDATSVAMRTRAMPVLKSSRACSLSDCSLRVNQTDHAKQFTQSIKSVLSVKSAQRTIESYQIKPMVAIASRQIKSSQINHEWKLKASDHEGLYAKHNAIFQLISSQLIYTQF